MVSCECHEVNQSGGVGLEYTGLIKSVKDFMFWGFLVIIEIECD